MSDLQGSWSMSSSSSSQPGGLSEDTMVALTIQTAGAIQSAPRRLHCWFSGTDGCIRDAHGELLWLATDKQTAWSGADGQINSVANRADAPGERAALLREPAPEAVAMHDLRSACAWLDIRNHVRAPVVRPVMLDRRVERFSGPAARFVDVSISCDLETGVILQILARSPDRGGLTVEASKIEVAARDNTFFDLVERL